MEVPNNKDPKKKKVTKPTGKVAKKKMQNKAETKPTGKDLPDTTKDLPENDAYFTKEFETYALWKSLPPIIKGTTPEDLEKKFFIDDEELIQLLQIRTQRQFADHYKINETTLWRWNKRLADRDLFADIRQWSNKLLKNVIMSTYRSSMSKDPKANGDRKLFLQFGGWGEEMTINNKGESLTEIFKKGLGIK